MKMPYYYKMKIKNFDEAYFNDFLNMADKTLNAILMKGKGLLRKNSFIFLFALFLQKPKENKGYIS